jgi:uncharacterized membrane protein YfcA
MNAVVGAGTLITFPTLLAAGYAPVTANASNCLGLVAGSTGSAWAFRRTIISAGSGLVLMLSMAVAVGAVVGGILVLALPAVVFSTAVPVLVAMGCVLMFVPSRMGGAVGRGDADARPSPPLFGAMVATGVYGGYFGAAQGVIMLGILRLLHSTDPVQMNAIKNLLGLVANATAGAIFVLAADVAWDVVLVISVGSVLGGVVGARVGRSLSSAALRAAVVVVAACAVLASLR